MNAVNILILGLAVASSIHVALMEHKLRVSPSEVDRKRYSCLLL